LRFMSGVPVLELFFASHTHLAGLGIIYLIW